MKKKVLSFVTIACLGYGANAVTRLCVETISGNVAKYDVDKVTHLCVETTDGNVVKYNTEEVMQVFYEFDEDTIMQGVSISGKVGDYAYVDLGLESGTKWAVYNIGGSIPSDSGDFFAWGEILPKDIYTWDNYKFGSSEMTKYTNYGDDLETGDDAATANWGKDWKMPTVVQFEELVSSCNWKRTSNFYGTGMPGRIGTSKYNGKTIFLPSSGTREETPYAVGKRGDFWASALDNSDDKRAYFLSTANENVDIYDKGRRFIGRSVRAVVNE